MSKEQKIYTTAEIKVLNKEKRLNAKRAKISNGIPRSGLKKGDLTKVSISLREAEVESDTANIINMQSFGVKKVTSPENVLDGVTPNTPLTVMQACREYGIHPQTFYNRLRKFPKMAERVRTLRENNREYLKTISESNLASAITGGLTTLTEKDKVDYSLKFLERTDKAYNPKIEIEKKELKINITASGEDLKNELIKLLGGTAIT